MIAILAKICAVGVCTIVAGPVDWSKPHGGGLIWVAGVQVITGHEFDGAAADDPDLIASGRAVKKIVGAKPVICKGEARNHNIFSAECYFVGKNSKIFKVPAH